MAGEASLLRRVPLGPACMDVLRMEKIRLDWTDEVDPLGARSMPSEVRLGEPGCGGVVHGFRGWARGEA